MSESLEQRLTLLEVGSYLDRADPPAAASNAYDGRTLQERIYETASKAERVLSAAVTGAVERCTRRKTAQPYLAYFVTDREKYRIHPLVGKTTGIYDPRNDKIEIDLGCLLKESEPPSIEIVDTVIHETAHRADFFVNYLEIPITFTRAHGIYWYRIYQALAGDEATFASQASHMLAEGIEF